MLLKVNGDPLNGQHVKGFGTREPELYKEFINNHQVQDEFRGCHKGERCFILGNGPTIKEHDLSLLEDEFVFTVNFASKLEQFKEVKSNYHVFMDIGGFETTGNDKLDSEYLKNIKKINAEGESPKCFFNYYAYDYVKENQLDEYLDIFYMFNYKGALDGIKCNYWNVVQHSIALAIHMGFDEIYLLGFEMTQIIEFLSFRYNQCIDEKISFVKTNIFSHAYNHTEEDNNNALNIINDRNFTSLRICEIFTYVLKDMEYLKDMQEERGGKLINCTPKTIIDTLPRKTLEDVLAGK